MSEGRAAGPPALANEGARPPGGERRAAPIGGDHTPLLSDAALRRIDREIAKYPPDQKQSAVMAALAVAQDEKGWLPPEAMDFVASYLGMPPVAVYEVASFYAMYNTQPVGKYKITICTNLPCALQDAVKAAEHLKAKLGVGFGETTPDGLVTLQQGECFGACGDAPVLLVNNKRMCSLMGPDKIDALLTELRGAGAAGERR